MASFRGGRDDRDGYYSTGRGPRSSREEVDIYERREERRSPPRRAPVREYEERDIRIERDRESRVPAFMRDPPPRRSEAGPLVLRQRDVETSERSRGRPRSPSPVVRVRERSRVVQRERSPSPSLVDSEDRIEIRDRVVERERQRIRSPSRGPPMERVRTRVVEQERRRSPSPPAVERTRTRIVERERSRGRGRSPSVERDRIRIIDRERERRPSPSPSPPPPPVIRGPTIEREVITHYTDVDHGMVVARPPSPPPPPRQRQKERDTEIDIYTSRHHTEVDIHESSRERGRPHRGRSPSHERPSPRPQRPHPHHHHDDEIIVRSDRNKLSVEIDEHHHHHHHGRPRRALSAAPPPTPRDDWDEGDYITSRINERGRMGEARHGHTKDWTIVDVPPGTERVRMDGVGGGQAEVTWQRYNGVRRARFIPDGDDGPSTSMSTALVPVAPPETDRARDRVSVQIYDKDREIDVEKVTDRRVSLRPSAPPPTKRSEMWTEITKDLVVRDAIEDFGYEYEETEWFFYVMQYLRYEDVLALVKRSDDIRRVRKDRVREIQWERDHRDRWHHHHHHHHNHNHHRRWHSRDDLYDDERIIEREREVIVDRPPPRGYLR